jgi:PAS domain S-box-containing protein
MRFFMLKFAQKIGRIICMNKQEMEHRLIEHILPILDTVLLNNLTEDYIQTELSPFSNSHNVNIAHEIIKFMNEMPGGFLIYRADNDERIIYVNDALLRIFGCKTKKEFVELTGNSFKGMVHPSDLDKIEQSIQEQIFDSQYDLDYVEYRIIRKDGEIRWIEDYGHFIHTQHLGDIFYVFLSDATEKRNRLLLEEASLDKKNVKEEHLQNLLEEYNKEKSLITQEYLRRLEVIEGLSINYESILYADLDTDKILPYRLSSRTQLQFGKKFQPRRFIWYISDYINTWVHPEDRGLVTQTTSPEYIRNQLCNNKTYYVNYRIINNGEIQYLQLRIVNVGNKKDISQIVMGYRRVDEEIRREMEQKQILEEALDNAKLAIIAKNTFLSNMSHDMRTPLNAIFGFTSLAKQHIDDTEAVCTYLDKLEIAGRQLLDLIDKTLELSWMETNNLHLTESECNICDIMQDIHKTLFPQAAQKNITFSVHCASLEHCDIYSDKAKLRQFLFYLAQNAITYTPSEGKVDITAIELKELPNDYAMYQFTIQDTGIGISKDFLKHIYEPFERESNTTISGIHGTGLGLTIVKNIVDMMGGEISVDSTVGIGTTFTVTLRFHTQNHPLSFSTDSKEIIAQLLNQKILLAEDNEINLEIEVELLQELGFLIETAVNGSIAVEKIKQSNPGEYALILMDIQMPVMDGREATQAIRKLDNPELANIPIIALSANAFESDKQLSIESGMDAHLTKPIDVPLLLESIAKTIYNHRYSKKNKEFIN